MTRNQNGVLEPPLEPTLEPVSTLGRQPEPLLEPLNRGFPVQEPLPKRPLEPPLKALVAVLGCFEREPYQVPKGKYV